MIANKTPIAVREIENVWIPMADGCRLSARIWLPKNAVEEPVPAILEYIPYRKGDWTAPRDVTRHPYFAGHGYASVRVDMRGSGDSDGILVDEYAPQEQDDALEVLTWLAAQPWCTGAVGMIGISWGGFNGLQVAALRPPELKAVISVCSTDDRYADDVHYMGGCLLASDMLSWASSMLAFNARPPDPQVVGERWREQWRERLERTPPFIEPWLSHQRRDAYWKHGSVCEGYDEIDCPVYMVGGWADGYTSAVLRFLAGYGGPRKGLIGPWGHAYPERGLPGPSIGFLQECLRWWDMWLKNIETGIMDEPMLRVWMQDSVPPRTTNLHRPGRWIAESSWPAPALSTRTYAVNAGSLDEAPAEEAVIEHIGTQATGLDAGYWSPSGPFDFPSDQRSDDGLSLSFTSAPLRERLEILGFPEVALQVAVDRPNALVAVRLCDVAANGASTIVTRGLLNLTHRESHEEPSSLDPGRRYLIKVPMKAVAHSFTEGHRLRVAVSSTYWPWAWPSPEPVELTVFTGGASRLELPVRPPQSVDAALAAFEPPEGAPPLEQEVLRKGPTGLTSRRDFDSGALEIGYVTVNEGWRLSSTGVEYDGFNPDTFEIVEGEPLSARVRCERRIAIGRGGWRVRVETRSTMSADAERFFVTNQLDAYESDVRIFTKTWKLEVPRDLL